MKKLLLPVAMILGMSPTLSASTTNFSVIIDPFTTVRAILDVPDTDDCTTNDSANLRVIDCNLQDATFQMRRGADVRVITLTKSSTLISTYGENEFAEVFYTGIMTEGERAINVSVSIRSKNNIASYGSLVINKDQVFTIF